MEEALREVKKILEADERIVQAVKKSEDKDEKIIEAGRALHDINQEQVKLLVEGLERFHSQVTDNIQGLWDRLTQMEQRLGTIESRLEETRTLEKDLEYKVNALRDSIQKLASWSEDIDKYLAAERERVKQREAIQKREVDKAIGLVRDELSAIREELSSLKTGMVESNNDLWDKVKNIDERLLVLQEFASKSGQGLGKIAESVSLLLVEQRKMGQLLNDIKSVEERVDKLAGMLTTVSRGLASLSSIVKEIQEDRKRDKAEIMEKQQNLTRLATELALIKTDIDSSKKELEDKKQELEALIEKASSLVY